MWKSLIFRELTQAIRGILTKVINYAGNIEALQALRPDAGILVGRGVQDAGQRVTR